MNINKLLNSTLSDNKPSGISSATVGNDAELIALTSQIHTESTDAIDTSHIIAAAFEEIADIAEAAENLTVGMDTLMACAQNEAGEGVAAYFSPRDARMITATFAAAGLNVDLGAVESWGAESNVVKETEGAVESVKERAEAFWKILVEKFYEFLDFIAEKTLALFGTAERLTSRAKAEAKKAAAYNGEVKKDKVKVNVKTLSIGETFSCDVDKIKALTAATDKVCIAFPANCMAVFEDVRGLLEDEGKMVELVKDGADPQPLARIVTNAIGAMDKALLSDKPAFLGNFYIEQSFDKDGGDSVSDIISGLKSIKFNIRAAKWTKEATKEMPPVASASAAEKLCEAVADLGEALTGTRTKIKDAKKFKSEIAKVQKAGEKAGKEDALKAKSFLPKGLGTVAAVFGMYANGNLSQAWMSNCVAAGNAALDYAKSAY